MPCAPSAWIRRFPDAADEDATFPGTVDQAEKNRNGGRLDRLTPDDNNRRHRAPLDRVQWSLLRRTQASNMRQSRPKEPARGDR